MEQKLKDYLEKNFPDIIVQEIKKEDAEKLAISFRYYPASSEVEALILSKQISKEDIEAIIIKVFDDWKCIYDVRYENGRFTLHFERRQRKNMERMDITTTVHQSVNGIIMKIKQKPKK